MKPTFTRLALLSATCGIICSCSTRQRVDYSWFRDTMVAAQDDQVTVEEGSGMTAAEATAPVPAPAEPVVATAPAPQPAAIPTAPAAAPPPETQPTGNAKGWRDWFSQQQPAPQSTVKVTTPTAYTVRSGDTLSVIARRHGVSLAALAQANNLTNPNALRIGQVLTIPTAAGSPAATTPAVSPPAAPAAATPTAPTAASAAPVTATGYYTVSKGDTLSGIARRHGTTVAKIMQANHMTAAQAHKLSIGQKIIIPNN